MVSLRLTFSASTPLTKYFWVELWEKGGIGEKLRFFDKYFLKHDITFGWHHQ
jgi:hypothetical protein